MRRLDPELRELSRLHPRQGRAIDVGANYGVYTYAFSRFFSKVEAFEPLPGCTDVIEAYGGSSISVHRVALSSRSGTQTLYVPQTQGTPDTGRASLVRPDVPSSPVTVPVRRLDDYGFTEVSVIKIDVEGHELDVLKGGADTLSRERPILLVEIEQRHLDAPMTDAFDYLRANRYEGFFLDEGKLWELERFSYEQHQRPYLRDTESPRYVNNFLFVPK